MSEAEALDRFVRGLKSHIRQFVHTQRPATFEAAAVIAERIGSIRRSSAQNYN